MAEYESRTNGGLATYKDGRFSCTYHGDLGEHDEAIEKQNVLYGGDGGGLDGYMCMSCLGEDVAASEEPTLAECPYCHQMHQIKHIEECQLKPREGNGTISI
jgi:hypothetical protein